MSEWISVKERLPEQDSVCVVYNSARISCYYIAVYSKFFNEFEVSLIGMSRLYDPITFSATYWMFLSFPDISENP